jgi:hypothetical protein
MDRLRSNVSPSYFFSAIYEEVSRKKRKDSKKRIRGDQSSTLIESMKQQFNQGRTQHSHSHNGNHLTSFRLLLFFSAIQLFVSRKKRKDSKKEIRGDQSSTLIKPLIQQFNQGRTQHSHSHNGFHITSFRLLSFFSAIQLFVSRKKRKDSKKRDPMRSAINTHQTTDTTIQLRQDTTLSYQ